MNILNINILDYQNIDDLNKNFKDVLNKIQNVLNIDIVYSDVFLKLDEFKAPKNIEQKDTFNLGIEREIKGNSIYIRINKDYKKFLPIILLREAFYCFIPQAILKNQTIKIIINLILEFELEKFEHINEWKQIFQEQFIDLNIDSPFFHTIDKYLCPDGSNLSESSIRFFFNYIRNNIQLMTEAKDSFQVNLIKEYVLKTAIFLFDDDIVEAIRILIKIFYKVKSYRALLEYKNYFKEFKQNNKISTELSLRRFTESVKWINEVSFIAPTYEINLELIDISWNYCSLTFHPALNKKKIDQIINKFPFMTSSRSSPGKFSYEISFWLFSPKSYENDIIRFIEKLEEFGYIIDKTLILQKEFKNNSINLNYFRNYYKKGRLINPKHPNYDEKYEISFETFYGSQKLQREWTILDTMILENIVQWNVEAIGFERRTNVFRLIKSRIIYEILSQKNLIKNIKKKIQIIQDNTKIKQFFITLLNNNKNFGFFYIKEYLEGIKKYLVKVDKILFRNPDIKNIFQFQEYIKKNGIFNKLDEAILFDRTDLKKDVFNRFIPLYFNNIEAFKEHLKYIGILSDFFKYSNKLKIFNINALMRIIEDKFVSEKIYIKKQEKLDNIRQGIKNKKITGIVVDEIIDEFCNTEPPLLIPFLISTLNTSNFAKYYLELIIKYSTETIEILSKIKHYFPRFVFIYGLNPFIKKKIIQIFIHIVNLNSIEKKILMTIFNNFLKDEIISVKRYFSDGFIEMPNIRSYYDLESQSFFYTKDLFEQYFNFVKTILGTKFKKFIEAPLKNQNLLWSSKESFDELINLVEDRFSRQQIDFNAKKLQDLEEFHSNLENLILNVQNFKQVKQSKFFKQYIKSIKFFPNFRNYGISHYFLYIRPLDLNQIDFRLLFNNTFQKIKFQASIGNNQSFFISYLFPFRNPNMSYINWLTKSKRIILEYCIFYIKSIHLILNFDRNLDSSGWDLDHKKFETHIQQILFNQKFKKFPLEIKTLKLSAPSTFQFLGPDTPNFTKLNNIYRIESIDIKSIVGTKRHSQEKAIIDLLKAKHLFPYLKLKNLDFQDKIYIILINLNKETIDKIIRIFSFFNYGFIYEIEGDYFIQELLDDGKFENGLMIKLYFPLCEISAFLKIFRKLFQFLHIKNFLILNDLISGKNLIKSIYSDLEISKEYNPLINLRWNNKDKIRMNNKLFNEKFEPFYPDLIPKENNNGS